MKKLLKRNNEMKEIKKHDTCFLLGLGPSLNDVDLDKISSMDADVAVVNGFCRMSSKTNLKPTFYAMVDTGFVASKKGRDLFEKAITTYPESTFIYKTNFLDYDNNLAELNVNKYFVSMYKSFFSEKDSLDITKVLPALGNSITASIGILLAIGYKKIILLGCDFNSFASTKRVHCYNLNEERHISIAFELFCYSFVAAEHMRLACYAKKNGVEILNATRGSLIDAYPVVDFEELYFKEL